MATLLSSASASTSISPPDVIARQRQRSIVLRSISHLHINAQQSSEVIPLENNEDDEDSTCSPFNRFELIQPPVYQQLKGHNKIRKGLIAAGAGSRNDSPRTSSSSSSSSSSLNTSQSSKIGAVQEKAAKAVAIATTKIKKQLFSSISKTNLLIGPSIQQPMILSPLLNSPTIDSSTASLEQHDFRSELERESFQVELTTANNCKARESEQHHHHQQVIIIPQYSTVSIQKDTSRSGRASSLGQSGIDDPPSNPAEHRFNDGHLKWEKNLIGGNNNTNNNNNLVSTTTIDTMHSLNETAATILAEKEESTFLASSTITRDSHNHHQQQQQQQQQQQRHHKQSQSAVACSCIPRHGDTLSTTVLDSTTSTFKFRPVLTSTKFTAAAPSSDIQRLTSPLNPSQTTLSADSSIDMTDIDERNLISFRRGSAPSIGTTKFKGSFRQGLLRLSGSTIDLHKLESDNRQIPRSDAHLESGQSLEDVEPTSASSPITPADDSPIRSRFSFSLNRRRPSQEATSKSFSFLSKFNKSRDGLEVTTIDAVDNDATLIAPRAVKGRKSSDASTTKRQFIFKGMRRSSRPSISAQDIAALPSRQQGDKVEAAGQAPHTRETADTVFSTAFGQLQKSDVHSAQAFEGGQSLQSGVDESSQMSRYRTSTCRASQDSDSASFFSTTEHPILISRPPSRFLSPFGSIQSPISRSTEHSPAQQQQQRITPETPPSQEPGHSLSTNEWLHQQEAPLASFDSLNASRDDGVVNSPPMPFHPGGSTNVSPSEHGSYLSRSTAPSSTMPSSDSMTSAALHLETEAGKPQSRTPAEQSVVNSEAADAGRENNIAEDSQGRSNTNGSSSANNRRTTRSSRLLHLPRLNSMHVFSGASGGGSNEGGEDGNGGDDQRRHPEESMGVGEEHSSDNESNEEEEEMSRHDEDESGTDTGSETEISIDSEAETSMEQVPLSAALTLQTDGGGIARPRPAGIALPPTPLFVSSLEGASAPAQQHNTMIGREAWQQFASTPSETPGIFNTPRPLAFNRAAAASSSSLRMTPSANGSIRTPKAPSLAVDDNSYFDLQPAPTPTAATRTGVAMDNRDMPPPSPSIISRSRAASSASRRSTRSSTLRDLPAMPPISPQQYRGVVDAVPCRTKSPPGSIPIKRDSLLPLPSYRSTATMQTRQSSLSTTNDIGLEASASRTSSMPPSMQLPISPNGIKPIARPGLYQQQSQSLIDLSAAKILKEPMRMPASMSNKTKQQKEQSSIDSELQTPNGKSTSGLLRRRRSMFEVGAQPPPYSVVHARPEGPQMIYPREEEGKEALPKYLCSVHIEGYLPRKMEFTLPGLQAKDRSWKRLYFVLHGTCLKVYKTDLSGDNMLGKGVWGEVEGVHVHKEPMNEDGPIGIPVSGTSHPKEGSSASTSTTNQGQSINHSNGNSNSTSSFNAAVGAVSAFKGSIYHGNKNSLIKTYSLQGAESGLAADYLKRRHVVRVRVEGEQFLLQTRNDRHVVDWIEAFQAATNVALDLERRPMPKFITLPRRRRRRRREAGADGVNDSVAAREEADLEEARRRSIVDASGGSESVEGRGSLNSSRLPPPRPLGLPGDELAIPSAAFDDMLREEHEGIMRQDASDV